MAQRVPAALDDHLRLRGHRDSPGCAADAVRRPLRPLLHADAAHAAPATPCCRAVFAAAAFLFLQKAVLFSPLYPAPFAGLRPAPPAAVAPWPVSGWRVRGGVRAVAVVPRRPPGAFDEYLAANWLLNANRWRGPGTGELSEPCGSPRLRPQRGVLGPDAGHGRRRLPAQARLPTAGCPPGSASGSWR